jgi:hypothetical protein
MRLLQCVVEILDQPWPHVRGGGSTVLLRVILYRSDKRASQRDKLTVSLIIFHMEMEIIFQSYGLNLTILLSFESKSSWAGS